MGPDPNPLMECTMQKANDNSNAASAAAPCPVQVLMRQISGLDAAYGELCTLDEGPTNDEKTDIWEANRILRDLVSITRAEFPRRGHCSRLSSPGKRRTHDRELASVRVNQRS